MTSPIITLKRVYEPPADTDRVRILVERLWPRAMSKARAAVDLWAKEAAPSSALRRWFGHDPTRWEIFQSRYQAELEARPEALTPIRDQLALGPVTFVYATRHPVYNSASLLKRYLVEGSFTD